MLQYIGNNEYDIHIGKTIVRLSVDEINELVELARENGDDNFTFDEVHEFKIDSYREEIDRLTRENENYELKVCELEQHLVNKESKYLDEVD